MRKPEVKISGFFSETHIPKAAGALEYAGWTNNAKHYLSKSKGVRDYVSQPDHIL